jgi:parallel beta-helix repeat protein
MPRLARSGAYIFLLMVAAVPSSAAAQPVLSVSPTLVNVHGYVGTNPTSQTIQVQNTGKRALKWSVVGPTDGWLTVSPTSGTNSGNIVLSFQTSALPVGVYGTSFAVRSNTGASFIVTVGLQIDTATALTLPPPPPPPTATSPDGATTPPAASIVDGSGSVWTIGAGRSILRNNVAAANGVGDLILWLGGSIYVNNLSYPDANGSWWQWVGGSWSRLAGDPRTPSVSLAPAPQPAPAPSGVGPQSTISCPAGAVDIWPGTSISSVVASYGGGTTFCIRAGIHYLTSSITPKTGNTFVGEYGAILDGSSWTTGDDTQAAFRAHNQDIDYVTIRNLVIRNMPQRGIHAYYYMSNNWTVEYTEIVSSKNVGIVFPGDSLLRNNYIHHNAFSGYMGPYVHNTTLEANEIAYNGWQQKVMESANVTFRNNFVHHNTGAGIWFDSNNTGALVEGNRVEDNGHAGIWYEISSDAIFRNNVIRRSADTAIFVSTSQNVQIYGNTLENNFRGIVYFLNCSTATGQGFDLRNNTAHDNTIVVGTQSGVFANGFSYAGCTATQVAPYAGGSKGLTFSRNTYRVPSLSGWYWLWDATKFWGSWQGLGMDVDGSISQ